MRPTIGAALAGARAACLLALLLGVSTLRAAEPGPVRFFAVLSAEEQSTTTLSKGTGRADFSLDRDTLRLSWRLSFSGLTSPATGAAVHGPQRPGTNAGIQIDLAPKSPGSPSQSSAVLTDAQLEYLLAGRMYVNVRSRRYPAGELRGQIQRVPPPAAVATSP